MEEVVEIEDSKNDEDLYDQTPVSALNRRTTKKLCLLLDPIKVIPTENGLPRDFHGLAELCGFQANIIPSINNSREPTKKVLELWEEQKKDESNVRNLLEYLKILDRFDIIEDIEELVADDVRMYIQSKSNEKFTFNYDVNDSENILTVDDMSRVSEGLGLQTYDAFVLFAEDDIDFATELIETMEKQYSLKLCVPYRDLISGSGVAKTETIIQLISERCRKLIVILSPAFNESSANKFVVSCAQAIGLEKGASKIIPCVYKDTPVKPQILCHLHTLDKRNKFWLSKTGPNFWDTLHKSIEKRDRPISNVSSENVWSRSMSANHRIDQTKALTEPIPNAGPTKSSMHHSENGKHLSQVRFSSVGNLQNSETDAIVPDSDLNPSTSANSLGLCAVQEASQASSSNDSVSSSGVKVKKSNSWVKNLVKYVNKNKNHHKSHTHEETASYNSEEIRVEKKKKHFFSLPMRRKPQVVAN